MLTCSVIVLKCEINRDRYFDMQFAYVDMQLNYADMKLVFVDMQLNYFDMRDK